MTSEVREAAGRLRRLNSYGGGEWAEEVYGSEVPWAECHMRRDEHIVAAAYLALTACDDELPIDGYAIAQAVECLESQRKLLHRAMAIIADAIMHGMPVTKEVAAVRNEIVGANAKFKLAADKKRRHP